MHMTAFGIYKNLFKKKISNVNLSYKIMICFILIAFIPILMLGSFYYFKMNEIILSQNKNNVMSDLRQVAQNIENNLQVCVQASQVLYSDSEINNFSTRRYKDEEDSYDAYITEIKPAFLTMMLNHKMVNGITLYIKNSTFQYPVSNIKPFEAAEKDGNFATSTKYLSSYWRSTNSSDGKNYISLYRLFNYFNVENPSGILRLDISVDYIRQLFSLQSPTQEYLVIDPEGHIITASKDNPLEISTVYGDVIDKVISKNNNGYFYIDSDDKSYLLGYETLKNKWKVISLVNASTLLNGTKRILQLMLSICALILFILFFTTRYVARRLTFRINTSVVKMHEIEAGCSIVLEESGDEIGVLNKSINTMVQSLNTMIQKVYITGIQKKEAQIQALQSQIDPHFLFNTLESIRMGSLENGDPETARMIRILAKLFRTKLDFQDTVISLEKELKIVHDYVQLQIYRFGKRLSFENHIDDSYLSKTVLKLTLQPLVENAIVHGIEKMEHGGCVTLDAYNTDDFFILTVTDSGIGIPEDVLQSLNTSLEQNPPSNGKMIGINSVHQRLRLFYGDNFGIKIYSDGQNGTTVKIMLPKENDHV